MQYDRITIFISSEHLHNESEIGTNNYWCVCHFFEESIKERGLLFFNTIIIKTLPS